MTTRPNRVDGIITLKFTVSAIDPAAVASPHAIAKRIRDHLTHYSDGRYATAIEATQELLTHLVQNCLVNAGIEALTSVHGTKLVRHRDGSRTPRALIKYNQATGGQRPVAHVYPNDINVTIQLSEDDVE